VPSPSHPSSRISAVFRPEIVLTGSGTDGMTDGRKRAVVKAVVLAQTRQERFERGTMDKEGLAPGSPSHRTRSLHSAVWNNSISIIEHSWCSESLTTITCPFVL
jgi:hypothetical protein